MPASSSNVFGPSARSRRSLAIVVLLVDRKIGYREISRTWWPIPDKTSENWGIYRPSRGNLLRFGRAKMALVSGTTRCTCGKRSWGERMERAASIPRCLVACHRVNWPGAARRMAFSGRWGIAGGGVLARGGLVGGCGGLCGRLVATFGLFLARALRQPHRGLRRRRPIWYGVRPAGRGQWQRHQLAASAEGTGPDSTEWIGRWLPRSRTGCVDVRNG